MRSIILLLALCSSTAYQHSIVPRMSASGSRRDLFRSVESIGVGSFGAGVILGNPRPSWAKLVYFPERSVENVAIRVRKLAELLEDLQVDIENEDWDFIVEYPGQFRSYVPAFTKYTDAAFPDSTAIDESLRFAMRYEVGKLFGAVDRLKKASADKDLGKTQAAFADISLAYDRYLKSGNLYEGDAEAVSGSAQSDIPVKLKRREEDKARRSAAAAAKEKRPNPAARKGSSKAPRSPKASPSPAPAEPRTLSTEVTYSLDEKPGIGDPVVVYLGPDTGKTGTLLGLSNEGSGKPGAGEASSSGVGTKAIVKTSVVVRGFREIIVVPVGNLAKRTGL